MELSALRKHASGLRRRISPLLWAKRKLLKKHGVSLSKSVAVYGPILVYRHPGSSITVGEDVVLAASPRRNSLEARGPVILRTMSKHSRISIGRESGLTSVTLSAAESIQIGKRVLMGSGVIVTDSDHHVTSTAKRRHLGIPAPLAEHRVIVEDDVFIGARAIVLKGVTIGRGSVIGAGSVVTKDVPPFSIAAGNPCKVVASVLDES